MAAVALAARDETAAVVTGAASVSARLTAVALVAVA